MRITLTCTTSGISNFWTLLWTYLSHDSNTLQSLGELFAVDKENFTLDFIPERKGTCRRHLLLCKLNTTRKWCHGHFPDCAAIICKPTLSCHLVITTYNYFPAEKFKCCNEVPSVVIIFSQWAQNAWGTISFFFFRRTDVRGPINAG